MNKIEERDMRKYIELNKKDKFITELHEELIRERQIINEKIKEIERLKEELQDTKEHLGEYLYEQEEENKRLNNIINELENEINIAIKELQPNELVNGINLLKNIKFTLQELKGSDK